MVEYTFFGALDKITSKGEILLMLLHQLWASGRSQAQLCEYARVPPSKFESVNMWQFSTEKQTTNIYSSDSSYYYRASRTERSKYFLCPLEYRMRTWIPVSWSWTFNQVEQRENNLVGFTFSGTQIVSLKTGNKNHSCFNFKADCLTSSDEDLAARGKTNSKRLSCGLEPSLDSGRKEGSCQSRFCLVSRMRSMVISKLREASLPHTLLSTSFSSGFLCISS